VPVIGIPVDLLLERIATRPSRDELVEHLQHLGCDVEGYATLRRFACERCSNLMEITETENPPLLCDRCGADFKAEPALLRAAGEKDVLRMELLAVRPDMFDPGGLARTLRNYFKENLDSPNYPMKPSGFRVTVDPCLQQKRSYRPWIACAVVRNFSLDDDRLRVIMKLQENLHWALGRDRKRASIGVYNLDSLQGTSFRYTAVEPEQLRFAPLGYAPDRAVTPAEVLAAHPKGVAYARLLTTMDRYPILFDEKDQVMALIPIINSEATKLTPASRNFFIDVTGLEERIVTKTLNTLVTSLAELDPKASIEQVEIVYGSDSSFTPNLTPQMATLDPERAARYIGVPLDRAGVVECLRRMSHRIEDSGSGPLTVWVPAYRNDIMHEVDLIEDVAIAYGYHNIVPCLVPTLTVGAELPLEVAANGVRSVLTGVGFFEVLTLILSSEDQQFDALRRPRTEQHVVIDNPISVEQTMIRMSLLPGLLDTLAANTDHEMPQSIFEIGNVSRLDESRQTKAREIRHLAAASIGPRIDFSNVRSVSETVLREFGYQLKAVASDDLLFIPGRGATILAVRGERSQPVGWMGEVHPEVLENFKLVQPTSVFELSLEALTQSEEKSCVS
jgi:phenylalanyl-tRNA synthetase beta chain